MFKIKLTPRSLSREPSVGRLATDVAKPLLSERRVRAVPHTPPELPHKALTHRHRREPSDPTPQGVLVSQSVRNSKAVVLKPRLSQNIRLMIEKRKTVVKIKIDAIQLADGQRVDQVIQKAHFGLMNTESNMPPLKIVTRSINRYMGPYGPGASGVVVAGLRRSCLHALVNAHSGFKNQKNLLLFQGADLLLPCKPALQKLQGAASHHGRAPPG
jgi:hypothetical protein